MTSVSVRLKILNLSTKYDIIRSLFAKQEYSGMINEGGFKFETKTFIHEKKATGQLIRRSYLSLLYDILYSVTAVHRGCMRTVFD